MEVEERWSGVTVRRTALVMRTNKRVAHGWSRCHRGATVGESVEVSGITGDRVTTQESQRISRWWAGMTSRLFSS